MELRSARSLAVLVCVWGGLLETASAAATPPTVTATNQVAECRNPTVSVWINAKLSSTTDPLPVATYTNRLPTDPNSYTTNSDPDYYPNGVRNVTIKACDHASPQNCTTKVVSVTVRDSLAPVIYGGQNKVVQCLSNLGTPGYKSSINTPYCADTCTANCPSCANPNTSGSTACTSCYNPCMSSCTSNPNTVTLDKPQVSDVCDPNATWVADVPPGTYPLGTTTLHVTGYDYTGNTAVKNVTVQVVDSKAPVFTTTPPSFNVLSHASGGSADPLNCQYCGSYGSGGTCNVALVNGTKVVMPTLSAIDNCTLATGITPSWLVQGLSNPTPQNSTICMPDSSGATVQFVATDGSGNTDTSKGGAATTATVAVAGTWPISLTVDPTNSTGYVRTGTVKVSANTSSAVTWTFVGANQPDAPVGNSNLVTATFSKEGSYCPLYVSAKVGSNGGATPYTCFGVDRTAPSHTFTQIPTGSAWPGSNTPVFNHGSPMPLVINAQDSNGSFPSGVQRVTAVIAPSQGANIVVYDNAYACPQGATSLTSCALSHYVAGCNKGTAQGGSNVCTCTAVDSTGECTTSGRLDFSRLPDGIYSLQITVTDYAGNVAPTQNYPFTLANLGAGMSSNGNNNLAGMLKALAAVSPVAALSSLNSAIKYAQSAATVFPESPGQSFLLAQQVWTQLDQAQNNGANVAFYENYVASMVQGEVRKVYSATQDLVNQGNITPWPITYSTDPNSINLYLTRTFLMDRGNTLRDFSVSPNNVMLLTTNALQRADLQLQTGATSGAMATAITGFNAMSLLFMDSTFASIYGRSVLQDDVGNPNLLNEGYYRQGPPSHFGFEVAQTLSAQLTRFTTLANNGAVYGIPPTVLTTLIAANANIQAFSAAVAVVKNANWNPLTANGFNNQKLVTQVYLNAVSALQQLQTIQGSSIYTYYWQTAIGLTLADVVNFSLYEGPTALICILWGIDSPSQYKGCSALQAANPPNILTMTGTLQNGKAPDWEAQVAECRYNSMMYALADGRLTTPTVGALDLFANSKCNIINLYNRYYGNGKYFASDAAILPATYGCPATPTNYTQTDGLAACGACTLGQPGSVDTPCDGVDSDCNGSPDDAYVASSCGCGSTTAQNSSTVCPCAASSSCVAGQSLPCTPGLAPSALDNQCNGKDNNCNGSIGESYLPSSCGVGGCISYSSCSTLGVLTACTPKAASSEKCNHADDNCNILVDEQLDNDGDGYGCPPCSAYTTQAKCLGMISCTWSSGSCSGVVSCTQCDSSVSTCPAVSNPNSLLCSGDVFNGAWTGKWDCLDNDPTVYPGGTEICDGKDNNCNGVVDEGVKNACGNCDPACTSTLLGTPGTPFTPTPNNSQNIAQNPNNGSLGLTSQALNTQFAWVANDTSGTVSKIDTVTGKEVARYCQALKTGVTNFTSGKDPTGATYDTRAEPTVCAGCGGCNRGSRTAVDKSGNVFIANRAHDPTPYQGTYTKIAASANGCIDVNGDGTIQTSADLNGDGVIDPNSNLPVGSREYWAELDECILWTRKPTTWDPPSGPQPSCNQPGWPPNNVAQDPLDNSYTDEQTACQNDPNSYGLNWYPYVNVCQWTNACTGNGDTSCASYTSQLTCDPNLNGHSNILGKYCTWTAYCTGASGCSNNSTSSTCKPANGCSWVGGCSATTCDVSNNDKQGCKGRSGCSWYQSCYNTGATPYSTYVGPIIPRAVAIDAQDTVWVGLYNRLGFMQVNPSNGYVKRWVMDWWPPYGGAIDKNGILWHSAGCCYNSGLAGINTNPNTVTYVNPDTNNTTWTWSGMGTNGPFGYVNWTGQNPGSGTYGIAVDGKNRVYLGSYPSLTEAAYRYDAMRDQWAMIPVSKDANGNRLPDAGIGRGLTVDANAILWVAQHGDWGGRLTGFDTNTLLPVTDVRLWPNGTIPIGVGVGYGGKIWTNNQGTYNVAVVDPQTGTSAFFPTGGPPYTYSDFTGSILRTFTAPSGSYQEIVNACYGFQVNSWVNLVWNGLTPTGTMNQGRAASPTKIRFRMRAANTLITKDANGNPVDPSTATNWSLWFPDDVSNPNKNASDPNRVYYWDLLPSNQWPVSGPCAGTQSVSGTSVTGCADLTALPTTYTWTASQPNQPIAYVQVQAILVSDGDNTVQPTLTNFQLSRTCPQL